MYEEVLGPIFRTFFPNIYGGKIFREIFPKIFPGKKVRKIGPWLWLLLVAVHVLYLLVEAVQLQKLVVRQGLVDLVGHVVRSLQGANIKTDKSKNG
jgi:hypothetical protein